MKKIVLVSKAPLNSLQVKPHAEPVPAVEPLSQKDKSAAPLAGRPPQPDLQAQIEQAYRQGRQEGQAASQEQIARIEKRLQQLLTHVEKSYCQWRQELAAEITTGVVQIVERLLLYYRSQGDYAIEKIVARAMADLQQVSGCTITEIQCSPQDLEVLQQCSTAQNFKISAAPQLTAGDCILHTNLGIAVVQLQDRIEQMLRLLSEER